MVTNGFSLFQFSEHLQAKLLFLKNLRHSKRHFGILDILKMSFFKKSPPELESFFQGFISIDIFYSILFIYYVIILSFVFVVLYVVFVYLNYFS
jgi:hypothetical protein